MKYPNIREEELKNKVVQDFFGKFDCTEIIRDIDFAVKTPLNSPEKLAAKIEPKVYAYGFFKD